MQLNPDILLASEESPQLLSGIAERLDAAAHWLAPLSIIGFTIEDEGLEGKISPERLEKMIAHAERLIVRSVRTEPSARRRVTDAHFRVGPVHFLVLYNADRQSYLIPLTRIIEALRQEAYSVLGQTGAAYKRRIVIGSATWLPKHGMLTPEAAVGRVLEAMTMARILPVTGEVYARLGLTPSSSDEIRLHEYGWDEALYQLELSKVEKTDKPEAAAPKRNASTRASNERSKSAAGTKGNRKEAAAPKPKRPWWQFWKR